MSIVRALALAPLLAALPALAAPPALPDGGLVPLPEAAPHADRPDAAFEARFQQAIEANIRALGLDRQPVEKNASALIHPLLPGAPFAQADRHGVSGFVDLNPAFPNYVRDYSCGTRTYDTAAGYNHAGTDYFITPFPWQTMAQGTVQVRAAAPGTLVAKLDGRHDRNCTWEPPTEANAVAIRHADGTVGRYLHLKRGSVTSKAVGASIAAGEVLGLVGSSGISKGPHLHFELSNALGQTIDPHTGQCNAVFSRWAEQPPYRDSRLLMVATHAALPVNSPACGEPERPHYREVFAPGETLYLIGYFRDLLAGEQFTIELRRPDGVRTLQQTVTVPRGGGNPEAYAAAYWWARADLPADAAPGNWTARYTYRGRTVESRFTVGAHAAHATGAWFNPAQPGHGLAIDVVSGSGGQPVIALAWYAFRNGEPVWIIGQAPVTGDVIDVPMLLGQGAQFPPAYRAADATLAPWGTVTLRFSARDRLSLDWQSSLDGFGSGSMPMQRLTRLADINTDGFDSRVRACMSGSWYNPAQDGHGLHVQVLGGASGRVGAIAWYVYRDGRPYWINGAAPISVDGLMKVAVDAFSGAGFPPAFNPDDVVRTPWGSLEFRVLDTRRAQLRWTTTRPGFPASGQMDLVRVTQPLDAACR